MSLHITVLGQGEPLILLHGWGFNGRIWDTTASQLAKQWRVYQVDLPGHGQSPMCDYNLANIAQLLSDALPKDAVWMGWSLGGLFATAVALYHPESVRGLVSIGSSPRFIKDEDWEHAMQPKVLQDFAKQLEKDTAGTIRRFLALQVKDSPDARKQLRSLHRFMQEAGYAQADALRQGLDLLLSVDLRNQLQQIQCPSLIYLGGHDALVPAGMADDCQKWWPQVRKICIKPAAHTPFLSHPELFLTLLEGFFNEVGLSRVS